MAAHIKRTTLANIYKNYRRDLPAHKPAHVYNQQNNNNKSQFGVFNTKNDWDWDYSQFDYFNFLVTFQTTASSECIQSD